jgi:hypothetical protein
MKTTPWINLLLGISLFASVHAGERRFAYNYDTDTLPAGAWEYEQWITWKHYSAKNRYDFRHELEYGITDKLQMGLYLVDWRYDKIEAKPDKVDYRDTAVELIYQLSDPHQYFLGSALYGEVAVGDEKVELEAKFLLQKNIGPFVAVYNLILEAEWEGENLEQLDEKTGVWGNSLGVSYDIGTTGLSVGLEALHEQEFPDWRGSHKHIFYAGPNLAYRIDRFFGVIAGLTQISDDAGEADNQVRLIVGASF